MRYVIKNVKKSAKYSEYINSVKYKKERRKELNLKKYKRKYHFTYCEMDGLRPVKV